MIKFRKFLKGQDYFSIILKQIDDPTSLGPLVDLIMEETDLDEAARKTRELFVSLNYFIANQVKGEDPRRLFRDYLDFDTNNFTGSYLRDLTECWNSLRSGFHNYEDRFLQELRLFFQSHEYLNQYKQRFVSRMRELGESEEDLAGFNQIMDIFDKLNEYFVQSDCERNINNLRLFWETDPKRKK